MEYLDKILEVGVQQRDKLESTNQVGLGQCIGTYVSVCASKNKQC